MIILLLKRKLNYIHHFKILTRVEQFYIRIKLNKRCNNLLNNNNKYNNNQEILNLNLILHNQSSNKKFSINLWI